jgi:hypothetical protein
MPAQPLQQIVDTLNQNREAPFEYFLDGSRIIGCWEWVDRQDFGLLAYGAQKSSYQYIVTIHDDNTWSEEEALNDKNLHVGLGGADGEISWFRGSTSKVKKLNINALSRDRRTGQFGVVVNELDPDLVKEPLQGLLAHYGYQRASGQAAWSGGAQINRKVGIIFGVGAIVFAVVVVAVILIALASGALRVG